MLLRGRAGFQRLPYSREHVVQMFGSPKSSSVETRTGPKSTIAMETINEDLPSTTTSTTSHSSTTTAVTGKQNAHKQCTTLMLPCVKLVIIQS